MPGWNEVTEFSDFVYRATPGTPASSLQVMIQGRVDRKEGGREMGRGRGRWRRAGKG